MAQDIISMTMRNGGHLRAYLPSEFLRKQLVTAGCVLIKRVEGDDMYTVVLVHV